MSFSKAAVKRFNELKEKNTTPAPGQYNVKNLPHSAGTGRLYCSERFKSSESLHSDGTVDSADFALPSRPPNTSSKRKLGFSEKAKSAEKSKQRPDSISAKQKEALELEIRKLLQQCKERESELNKARDEVQKLQCKLATSTKDKLHLESRVATLEKSVSSLQRTNDAMEAQKAREKSVKAVEDELKETKVALQTCKQEYNKKQMQCVTIEADLQVAKSRISSLEDANKMLDKLNSDIRQHDNDVTDQVTRLQDITTQLRTENKNLQNQLETSFKMLQQVQDFIRDQLPASVAAFVEECQEKTKIAGDTSFKLQQRIDNLKDKVGKLSAYITELQNDRSRLNEDVLFLREKIGELKNEKEAYEDEKKLLKSQIASQKGELESSKEETANLQEKLAILQDAFDKTVANHQAELNQLKDDCDQIKQAKETEEKRCRDLLCEVDQASAEKNKLQSELNIVVDESESLQANLKHQNEENSSLKTECEELTAEMMRLQDDHDVQLLKLEEQMAEIKKLKDSVEESKKTREHSESRCLSLEASLKHANTRLVDLEGNMEEMSVEVKNMEDQHEAKLGEFTRRILETQKKLNQRDADLKATKVELTGALKKLEESAWKDEEILRLKEEKQSMEMDLNQITTELNEIKLEEGASNSDELVKEVEKWKCAYEELEEKIKPFETQLNAYSAEKAVLLNETNAAHAEVSQLGRRYAELLGHQNHKQKIKHIVKLKEQNIDLKEENHKLRLQVSSLQKQVVSNRKPRFDPSKAFQHQKENADPNAAS